MKKVAWVALDRHLTGSSDRHGRCHRIEVEPAPVSTALANQAQLPTSAASTVERGRSAGSAQTASALPRLGKPSLTHSCSSFSLAPARDDNHTSGPEDDDAKRAQSEQHQLVPRQSANSSRKRGRVAADVAQHQKQQQQLVPARLNPYDLRGAPPQSTRASNP